MTQGLCVFLDAIRGDMLCLCITSNWLPGKRVTSTQVLKLKNSVKAIAMERRRSGEEGDCK